MRAGFLIVKWTARVLSIAFIGFISLFALDAMGNPNWPVALSIHLLPSLLLTVITIIAWRWGKVGGVLFVVVWVLWFFSSRFQSYVISVPAIIVGSLFVAEKCCFRVIK